MKKTGKTGRKELFMTAKDKKELNVAGTIVGFMRGDTIVIDPDEFRKRAAIRNKEFYESAKDEDKKPESQTMEKDQEGSDAEKLSNGIVEFLAESAANSFAEIMDVIPDDLGEIILDLLNQADSEMFVNLLQAIFSIAGMEYAAEQLELMKYCYEYDDFAYCCFEDEFIDNDATEEYFTAQLFKDLLQEEHDGKRR